MTNGSLAQMYQHRGLTIPSYEQRSLAHAEARFGMMRADSDIFVISAYHTGRELILCGDIIVKRDDVMDAIRRLVYAYNVLRQGPDGKELDQIVVIDVAPLTEAVPYWWAREDVTQSGSRAIHHYTHLPQEVYRTSSMVD